MRCSIVLGLRIGLAGATCPHRQMTLLIQGWLDDTATWRSWKRAGLITPRSLDRNELLLYNFFDSGGQPALHIALHTRYIIRH